MPKCASPAFSKTKFSMVVPEVKPIVDKSDLVVLFGIEAHVCVLQTVQDLVELGKTVAIAVDGTHSQLSSDRKYGLKLMDRSSDKVILSTSESILLQLVRDAKSPSMKPISLLLRDRIE